MRKMKVLGKRVSPVFLALLIAGLLVSGALVVLLGQNYNVDVAGNIDVNGQTQEEVAVTYDGTVIEEALMLTTMDYATLGPGDDLSTTHTFANTGSRDYQLTLTTDLPANGDPADLWYGFDVGFLKHSDLTPITSVIDLDHGATYEADYTYTVDPAFEDPLIDYPFHIYWDIDEVIWRILSLSSAGNGGVACVPDEPRYLDNTELTITGTPDANYVFDCWSGDYTGTDNPHTFNIISDMTIVGNFIENLLHGSFGWGVSAGSHAKLIDNSDVVFSVYDSGDVLLETTLLSGGSAEWHHAFLEGGTTVTFDVDGIDVDGVVQGFASLPIMNGGTVSAFEAGTGAYILADCSYGDTSSSCGIVIESDGADNYWLLQLGIPDGGGQSWFGTVQYINGVPQTATNHALYSGMSQPVSFKVINGASGYTVTCDGVTVLTDWTP